MSSDDIIKKSRALDRKIENSDIGVRLTKVDRLVRWLTYSGVFDVILSMGLAVFGYVAYDASKNAQASSTQARINCLSANQSRRVQAQLWNYVLSLPPSTDETPSQKKIREENTKKFKTYIDKAFAPRDCSQTALSKPTPPKAPDRPSPAPAPSGKAASAPPSQAMGPSTTTRPQPTTAPQPQPPRSSEPSGHPSRSPPPPTHSASPSASPSPSPGLICRVTHVCIEEETWRLLRSALDGSTPIAMADVITLIRNTSLVNAYVEASVPMATSLPPTTSWLLSRVTSALSSSSATPVGS